MVSVSSGTPSPCLSLGAHGAPSTAAARLRTGPGWGPGQPPGLGMRLGHLSGVVHALHVALDPVLGQAGGRCWGSGAGGVGTGMAVPAGGVPLTVQGNQSNERTLQLGTGHSGGIAGDVAAQSHAGWDAPTTHSDGTHRADPPFRHRTAKYGYGYHIPTHSVLAVDRERGEDALCLVQRPCANVWV